MSDTKYEVNAGFFDAIDEDRKYSADDMNRPYKRLISNGVFAKPSGEASTDLQVLTANNGMNVIVSAGDAFIGNKWFENESDLNITISQNSETLSRIDSIIAQVDKTKSGRSGYIVYRKGTASSNPVHPDINTEENIYELRLADITVSSSCNEITQDLITDCRGSSECLWITSLILQVDTSVLYEQWKAAYQKYYDDQEAETESWFSESKSAFDAWTAESKEEYTEWTTENKEEYIKWIAENEEFFLAWFESIKNQLSEDQAGNLQLQIDEFFKALDPLQTEDGYYLATEDGDTIICCDFDLIYNIINMIKKVQTSLEEKIENVETNLDEKIAEVEENVETRTAVVSGSLTVEAESSWAESIDYPDGFTNENCVAVYSAEMSPLVDYGCMGSLSLNANSIAFMVINPNTSAKTISYKIVLLKTN